MDGHDLFTSSIYSFGTRTRNWSLNPYLALPSSSRLARRLLLVERVLVRQPLEHAFVFQGDGTVVFHLTSRQPDHITVLPAQEQHLAGTIFTHNHPGGHSLSEADLEFAMLTGIVEIRAVTSAARYSIRPPEQGWPYLARVSLRSEVARHRTLLLRELRRDIARGLLSEARAELEFEHRLWARIAEAGLLRYSVEPWPGE
jgi:hypothetical protein